MEYPTSKNEVELDDKIIKFMEDCMKIVKQEQKENLSEFTQTKLSLEECLETFENQERTRYSFDEIVNELLSGYSDEVDTKHNLE